MRIVQNSPSLLELRSNTIWVGILFAVWFIGLGIFSLFSKHAWCGAVLIPAGIIFFVLCTQGSHIRFDSDADLANVHHWSLFKRENYSVRISDIARVMPQEVGVGENSAVILDLILEDGSPVRLTKPLNSGPAMKVKFALQDFLNQQKEIKS